jgi:hypothetical protein
LALIQQLLKVVRASERSHQAVLRQNNGVVAPAEPDLLLQSPIASAAPSQHLLRRLPSPVRRPRPGAYLSRYTHRVAIANSRLISLADGTVRFSWKDYRADAETKVTTLAADEFIRRFLLHALPDAFHRIRRCQPPINASAGLLNQRTIVAEQPR